MDLFLVGLTGLSLLLAAAMGGVVFKLLRDEQQRSNARVALLRTAAEEEARPVREPEAEIRQPGVEAALPIREDMFAVPDAAPSWGGRAGVVVALVACTLLAGYAVRSGVPRPVADARAQEPSAPLELLALEHAQVRRGELTVSGMVRNPRAGGGLSHVVATASAFASDGTLLATGRSHLDYVALQPGDESPFVIKVSVSGAVSRYRVGFRSASGAVIAHVDRRFDSTSVRNDEVTGSVPWAP